MKKSFTKLHGTSLSNALLLEDIPICLKSSKTLTQGKYREKHVWVDVSEMGIYVCVLQSEWILLGYTLVLNASLRSHFVCWDAPVELQLFSIAWFVEGQMYLRAFSWKSGLMRTALELDVFHTRTTSAEASSLLFYWWLQRSGQTGVV